jgi:hypothetical protein
MKKLILALLAVALPGCSSMTPEERSAWTQFGLESARAYRDVKLVRVQK